MSENNMEEDVKFIDLIFSIKQKDELFQETINSIRDNFYDVGHFNFLFPVESKILGEILSALDFYFEKKYGLEHLANHIYCGDCDKITIDDRLFDIRYKEEVIEMLKFLSEKDGD